MCYTINVRQNKGVKIMRIKFSLGVKQNEPSFFFEGELKGFSDSVHDKNDIENAIRLFEHLTKKNSFYIEGMRVHAPYKELTRVTFRPKTGQKIRW